jgi:hypothetical protein
MKEIRNKERKARLNNIPAKKKRRKTITDEK